jgi:transcriptional regulator with XRE-family HTH domain
VAVLRFLVSKSGYTQRALAEQLDISKSKVGAILIGQQYLEVTELVDWLKALEITPAEFFVLLDSPPPLD